MGFNGICLALNGDMMGYHLRQNAVGLLMGITVAITSNRWDITLS